MSAEHAPTRRWKPYPAYRDSGVEWLGEVPEHWGVRRLKTICSVNPEALPETTPATHELEYVDIGDVDSWGNVLSSTRYEFRHAPSRARRPVRANDVILSTVRTYLTAIAHFAAPAPGTVVSTGFAVLRAGYEVEPRYLRRGLQSPGFVQSVAAHSVGVSYPAIAPSVLGALRLALPPVPEQHAIADFLDRETARLDALVARMERLVELLQEKRSALISHVVTKGLDPSAPMKDSGVDWLGQVPEGWEVIELRRLVRRGTSVTYGIVQAGPDVPDGVPYIRTSDMSGSTLPDTGYLRAAPEIDAAYRRSKVETGDLVVAIRATVGKTLRVPPSLHGANLTQGTARVCPGPLVTPDFLLYSLGSSAPQQRLEAISKGATFREITLDMLRRLALPVPPPAEQHAIADHLDGETAKLDTLAEKVRLAIERLKEYRTALISAAVTGKIDVRDEVQRGTDAG